MHLFKGPITHSFPSLLSSRGGLLRFLYPRNDEENGRATQENFQPSHIQDYDEKEDIIKIGNPED